MLKVNIFPYLGDLGVEKSCRLGKFCFNNSHHVLCALRRKHQLVGGVLVPRQRTVRATVSQTIVSYLVFALGLKVYLNKK